MYSADVSIFCPNSKQLAKATATISFNPVYRRSLLAKYRMVNFHQTPKKTDSANSNGNAPILHIFDGACLLLWHCLLFAILSHLPPNYLPLQHFVLFIHFHIHTDAYMFFARNVLFLMRNHLHGNLSIIAYLSANLDLKCSFIHG